MLGLKLVTDPRWVTIVESNIEEILTDHAWCEQKAATNIITIITYNSEHEELVTDLLEIAKEELKLSPYVQNYPSLSKMIMSSLKQIVNSIKDIKKSTNYDWRTSLVF